MQKNLHVHTRQRAVLIDVDEQLATSEISRLSRATGECPVSLFSPFFSVSVSVFPHFLGSVEMEPLGVLHPLDKVQLVQPPLVQPAGPGGGGAAGQQVAGRGAGGSAKGH